jgi:hypothetical protein
MKTTLFARIVTVFLVALVIMSTIFYEFYSMSADSDREKLSRVDPTIPVTDSGHFFLLNETLSSLKTELLKVHNNQKIATAANNPRHDPVHPVFESNELDATIPVKAISPTVQLSSSKAFPRKTALLYTMDSIKSYQSESERGGAAGEILIRSSLEKIFQELNVVLDVKGSDKGTTSMLDNYLSGSPPKIRIFIEEHYSSAITQTLRTPTPAVTTLSLLILGHGLRKVTTFPLIPSVNLCPSVSG